MNTDFGTFNPYHFFTLQKLSREELRLYRLAVYNTSRGLNGLAPISISSDDLRKAQLNLEIIRSRLRTWAWKNMLRDLIRRHIITIGQVAPHLSHEPNSTVITRVDLVNGKLWTITTKPLKGVAQRTYASSDDSVKVFLPLFEDEDAVPMTYGLPPNLTLVIPADKWAEKSIHVHAARTAAFYDPVPRDTELREND